uniref:Uncharacterized protein n=1 Tax=Anguilla anguilla TaxID=7936 RepID=A0A0E9RCD0_ANGAN
MQIILKSITLSWQSHLAYHGKQIQ